jgi:hypothetical protein
MKSSSAGRRPVLALWAGISFALSVLILGAIAGGMFRAAAAYGFHP